MHLPLLMILACQTPKPDTGPIESPPDTSVKVDSTESGDSSGETGQPITHRVSGQVLLPEGTSLDTPLTAALVQFRLGEGPEVGDTLGSALLEAKGDFDILIEGMPADVPDHPINEFPDMEAWFYALILFEDLGDGQFREGEIIRGMAVDRWIVALRNTSGTGLPEGWSSMDLGFGGQYEPNRCLLDTSLPFQWRTGYPLVYDVEEPISVLLRGLEASLELAGTVISVPKGVGGIAGLPYPDVGSVPVAPAWDQILLPKTTTFSARLDEVPPESDDVGSDPDWRYTMHLNLLYADVDADGHWSEGDSLEGSSTCYEGQVVWSQYTRPVDTWRGYRMLDCYSGNVGWRPATSDPDTGYRIMLEPEVATMLVVDPVQCRMD